MKILLSLLAGSASILATWIVLFLAFAGIGFLLRRPYRVEGAADRDEWFGAFWVGFAGVILFLQIWHFARPVDGAALAVVLITGAAGLLVSRPAVAAAARISWREHRLAAAVMLLFSLWVANRSMGPVTLYDSGMYHIPFVEWAKAFPVVPGLGNLNGRLAFNSSSLLYAALLDVGPWRGGANHLANGLLLLVLSLQVLAALFRFGRGEGGRRDEDLFAMMLLPPLVMAAVTYESRSLSTDLTVTLVVAAAAMRLFADLTAPAADEKRRTRNFAETLLLLTTAVCIKLSMLVFAAAAMVLALYLWRIPAPKAPPSRRSRVIVFVLPALLGATWLARGVILSGYPLYPSRVLAAPVAWRVAEEQASAEAAWITMSARYLNLDRMGVGWDWLGFWVKGIVKRGDMLWHLVAPLLITLAAAIAFAALRRARQGDGPAGRGWLLFVPLVLSLVPWAVAAPHPRFAQVFFWLMASTSVAILYRTFFAEKVYMRPRLAGLIAVTPVGLTLLVYVALVIHGALLLGPRADFHWLVKTVITLPARDGWFHPVPEPSLERYETASGLALFMPKSNDLCWRGPLLCTPHPAPNLRLRVPGDLGRGFVTDGRWEPARWPDPWTPFLPYLRCRNAPGTETTAERDRECYERAKKTTAPNPPNPEGTATPVDR